jgi:hypothetical protein
LQGSGLPTPVAGDELAGFLYNPVGPTSFTFGGTNNDIPAAPSGVGAVAGVAGGVTVTWTPPANQDVTSYTVYRVLASAVPQVYAAITGGLGQPANPATPTFTDLTAVVGTSYNYVVAANALFQGPASTPFTFAPPGGGGASTPVINSIVVTGGAVGSALVTYNQNVLCGVNAATSFVYSNTAGTPGGLAKPGATCADGPLATQVTITFGATNGATPPVTETTGVAQTNDTVKYTAPTQSTTGNAVYAGGAVTPQFAATQTVTDNGTGTSPLQ